MVQRAYSTVRTMVRGVSGLRHNDPIKILLRQLLLPYWPRRRLRRRSSPSLSRVGGSFNDTPANSTMPGVHFTIAPHFPLVIQNERSVIRNENSASSRTLRTFPVRSAVFAARTDALINIPRITR